MLIFGSTFSLQMIPRENCSVNVEWITPEEVNDLLDNNEWLCTVGHENTAMILNKLLGRDDIFMNRIRSSMGYDDTLLIGQLIGQRLPEGCTELPEGIEFTFVRVTLQRK